MTPFVTVNCAASADGKIALSNRRKVNLSNRLDLERLHNLRAENDAILVGIETVLQDDPSLTIRNNSSLIQLKMKKVEEIGDGVLITYTKK